MFLLINIGWLIFREQNPAYLWQFLTSSPVGVSIDEWRIGAYFLAFSAILLIAILLLKSETSTEFIYFQF